MPRVMLRNRELVADRIGMVADSVHDVVGFRDPVEGDQRPPRLPNAQLVGPGALPALLSSYDAVWHW
jgi:hypothetical protein